MLDSIIQNFVTFALSITCFAIVLGIVLLLFKWDDKQTEKWEKKEHDSWVRGNKQKDKSDDL
jgi:hypothetical protein